MEETITININDLIEKVPEQDGVPAHVNFLKETYTKSEVAFLSAHLVYNGVPDTMEVGA